MSTEGAADQQSAGKWDQLVQRMQHLRHQAGDPSYAVIAQRIMERREQAGATAHEARIAKSTVHAAFREGRSRVNLDLVREIALALGGDDTLADQWVAGSQPVTLPLAAEPEPPPTPSLKQVALLLVSCVVLNLAGREFVDFFNFPIYLDMLGTAIAAIALGPWRGASVGLATNVVGILGSGWISLPFALVNIVGALVWGYGVRRFAMGKTLLRFFSLNILTAVACSLVAVPIIVTFLGLDLRVGHDVITQLIEESEDTFFVAVSFSNLLTSLGDKLISGFVALVAITALPYAMRHRVPLVLADQPPLQATSPESTKGKR